MDPEKQLQEKKNVILVQFYNNESGFFPALWIIFKSVWYCLHKSQLTESKVLRIVHLPHVVKKGGSAGRNVFI